MRALRLSLAGLLLASALAVAGCAGTGALNDPYAGATAAYEPGVPTFDLEAQPRVRADTALVRTVVAVPFERLVFVQRGGRYEAVVDLSLRLRDRRGRDLVLERTRMDTVRVERPEETRQLRPLVYVDTLPAAPGRYVAEAVLTDGVSDAEARRRVAVEVPAPEPVAPALGPLALEGRRLGRGYEPIVAPVVPAALDSLRAELQLLRPDVLRGGDVRMRLLRFRRDTTVAQAPYWLSPSFGTLTYRGVAYGDADTVQVTRRAVPDADGPLEVAFTLPALVPGVYRVEVQARAAGGSHALREARDFLVAAPAFPRVGTLRRMAEALPYIAYEREWKHVLEAETEDELKRRFDAFWGGLLPSRRAAADLLERYYARIEEANRLFTTYKEGWKTDRGMVYVILGPPIYAQTYLDREVWRYGYSEEDPLHTFVFERVPVAGSDGLFENYVLKRQPGYDYAWLRALERWRTGKVL